MARHRWRPQIGAAACVAGVALLLTSSVDTAGRFSDWSVPVNLGEGVNSAFEEFLPELSKNGRSLYFASNRPGPFGGEDLWVSRRAGASLPWGPAENLGAAVNSESNERSPALSRDGHLLFFACEAVLGRPISVRKREIAQQVGFVLLMMLMVFALYNDVSRLGWLHFLR